MNLFLFSMALRLVPKKYIMVSQKFNQRSKGPHFFKAGDALPQDGVAGVAGLGWWFFSAKRSQVNS